jgi:hypothetical protein
MSIWNNSSPEERITMWRNFREEIRDLTKEEKLNKVATFFAKFPVGARCIDFYTPADWPTPWEILYHKTYCANTVSLLQYHTLATMLPKNEISVVLIDDGRDRFLVPLIDKTYILNYILGEVTDLQDYKEIRIVDDFANTAIPHIT